MNKLITDTDKDNLLKIRKIIEKNDKTDQHGLDFESEALYEAIDRAIYNLENGLNYFKKLPESEHHWFYAQCSNCGWWGSSEYLQGGGQIADTGDYGDCYYPVCGSKNVD